MKEFSSSTSFYIHIYVVVELKEFIKQLYLNKILHVDKDTFCCVYTFTVYSLYN